MARAHNSAGSVIRASASSSLWKRHAVERGVAEFACVQSGVPWSLVATFASPAATGATIAGIAVLLQPLSLSGAALRIALALGPGLQRRRWRRRRGQRLTRAVASTEVSLKDDVEDVAANDSNLPWFRRHLPPAGATSSASELEASFFAATDERGLGLYEKQREAISEVFRGKHVVLSTPTGSGKSLVGAAMLFRAVGEGRRAFYTCPVKALVNEKFFDLCKDFGPEIVGMATGDVSINPDAPVICCTAEVLAHIGLRDGPAADVHYAVMDEFHYFGDKGRGFAWEAPLLRMPHVTFLLMSATMGDNPGVLSALEANSGRGVCVVSSKERPVPLDWSYKLQTVKECVPQLVKEERTPVYVVNFTQADAAACAGSLKSTFKLSEDQKKAIEESISEVNFDTPFGPTVRTLLQAGVGLHHAGLLPKYRLLVEHCAQEGILTVVSGTDTLGVGVNVPIRSVLFTQLCKYDGEGTGILGVRDFHQIAGRAGRRGYDTQGSVVAVEPEHSVLNERIRKRMKDQPRLQRQLRKSLVKEPKFNYMPWNKGTFDTLRESEPETLESQFRLTQGTVLSVLQGAQEHGRDGRAEMTALVEAGHCSPMERDSWLQQLDLYVDALQKAGLILIDENDQLRVSEKLQPNFFLMEDVTLFLVDVLPLLEWEYSNNPEEYARAVLSLVEAISEDPKAVLKAQTSRARFNKSTPGRPESDKRKDKNDRDKPLPGGMALLSAFDEFVKTHPWVSREALKPKAIVLEMYEKDLTFTEFVKDLAMYDETKKVVSQEGLLLRYLTQVHKTLRFSVPEEFKTNELLEIEAFVLVTIGETDTSLLREWEALKALQDGTVSTDETLELSDFISSPEARVTGELVQNESPQDDIQMRALKSRVRVEARRLARRLAVAASKQYAFERAWHQAQRSLRPSGPKAWNVTALEKAMLEVDPPASTERDAAKLELEETADGILVHVQVLAKGDPSRIALRLRAFAPWPANDVEPLLELHELGPGEG